MQTDQTGCPDGAGGEALNVIQIVSYERRCTMEPGWNYPTREIHVRKLRITCHMWD